MTRPYARLVGVTTTFDDVELLGVTEVAGLLGISRQRVQQLTETDPDFPEPTANMARGRVWSRDDIVEWARATGRTIQD
jgi:predicted DNA-binding transcriptional regulator AlpA